MAIVYRTDSDGTTHQVWAQQQAASCAVASIWMARNQALQATLNESEWSLAWSLYQQAVQGIPLALASAAPAPRTFDPEAYEADLDQKTFRNMFSGAGTSMAQVAVAVRNDRLQVTHLTEFRQGITIERFRLSDTTPAIVLLGWYDGQGKRHGGHFIVASRATKSGAIVYLDPWDGKLQELGVGPQYGGSGCFEQVLYIARK